MSYSFPPSTPQGSSTPALVAVPATVKKLRLRRGYTMEWVSQQIGRQKSWASKVENGKLKLSGEDLISYANILDVHPKLMTQNLPSVSAEGLMFRKYRTPMKTVNRLEAEAEVRVHILDKLLDLAEQPKKPLFPQYNVESIPQGAVGVAHLIRERWQIGENPVQNRAGFLEQEGIFITNLPEEIEKVTAASYWHLEDSAPIIMLSKSPIDNTKRFTLAHEFAHLILDKLSPTVDSPKELESRADVFAGELIAPYHLIRSDFLNLKTGNIEGLLPLAEYWGLHPKSFITRASKLGDISKDQATAWYKRLNGSFKEIIETTIPRYPVHTTAVARILEYLKEYKWTPGLLMKKLDIRITDFKEIMGEDHWNFTDTPIRGALRAI